MEKYKKSKYNFIVKKPDSDNYIITNIMTNKMMKINSWHKFIYDNTEEFVGESKNDKAMIENGILVKKDFDEMSYIISKLKEDIYNNKEAYFTICVTSYCNLACVYCFEGKNKENINMDNITQEKTIEFIENILKKSKTKRLRIWWYGGEPLFCPDIIEKMSKKILKIVDELNIEYIARVVTNGVLFDQKMVETLEKLRVTQAQITLDGMSAETHDKTRPFKDGRGSFDIILNNLYNIKTNMDITILFVLNKNNKEDVGKMNSLIDDIKNKTGNNLHLNVSDVVISKYNFDSTVNIKMSPEDQQKIVKNIKHDAANKKVNFKTCMSQHYYLYTIDVKGNIYKCPSCINNEKYRICNVMDKDIYDKINNSEASLAFIDNIWLHPEDKCKNCTFFPFCAGTCIIQTNRSCHIDKMKEFYQQNILDSIKCE